MLRFGVCAVLVVMLLLGAFPAVAAFTPDDYAEVDFSWMQENPVPGPSGNQMNIRCQLVSPDPTDWTEEIEPTDWHPTQDGVQGGSSPCVALEYAIGNSDKHVYFRWTLANAEFGALGQDAALEFWQRFTGSEWTDAPDEARIEFAGVWVNGGEPTTTDTNIAGESGAWADDIEWAVDSTSDYVLARVPIELLEPYLKGGIAVDSALNITRDPKLSLRFLADNFETVDEIPRDPGNTTFRLGPYLDLQPAARTFYEDHEGFPLEVEVAFDEVSTRKPWDSNIYQFNWTMDHAAFTLSLTEEITEGSATVTVADPDGEVVFDSGEMAVLDEPYVFVPTGTWIIQVEVERFVGTVKLAIDEAELPEEDDPDNNGNNGNTGNNGSNENETDGNTDVDQETTPGPGVVVILAVLAALVGLRRRR